MRLLGPAGFWDIPNHRSMHKKATPTSGGIAIGVSYWIAICLAPFEDSLGERMLSLFFMAVANCEFCLSGDRSGG